MMLDIGFLCCWNFCMLKFKYSHSIPSLYIEKRMAFLLSCACEKHFFLHFTMTYDIQYSYRK